MCRSWEYYDSNIPTASWVKSLFKRMSFKRPAAMTGKLMLGIIHKVRAFRFRNSGCSF